MSSHHIIREDQEPALLLDDLASGDYESIQQLLEWSPTVLVTERALEQMLLWGIKLDVVIAVESHVEHLKTALIDQSPIKILSCAHPDEAIKTALYFLAASKQKAVHAISSASFELFEDFPMLDVSVIRQGRRWTCIRNGKFEKWLPAGTSLSFYPNEAHPEFHAEKDGLVTIQRNHSFWISEK